jgi:hypothetical protein
VTGAGLLFLLGVAATVDDLAVVHGGEALMTLLALDVRGQALDVGERRVPRLSVLGRHLFLGRGPVLELLRLVPGAGPLVEQTLKGGHCASSTSSPTPKRRGWEWDESCYRARR